METTITLSDLNAGTYTFTNTTAGTITDVTYVISENITLTN
jgi:hypothetical protein